jgi:flagellar motor switch protein FliM
MSSEIRSQNDIDLLLGGPAGGQSVERPKARAEAMLYDFRRPHRVSKEQLRTLEAMYERLVKSMEGWILGRVRGKVELTLQGVEQLSFSEFALSLPTPCCSYLLEIHDAGGQQGVIEFGHEFAFFLIDRMLGGRHEPFLPQRSLTPIEQMVVRSVAERTTVALAEIWQDYVRLEMGVSSFQSIAEILRATGGDDAVLVARVLVSVPGIQSLMSLCLPFSVLDTFFADGHLYRRGMATGSDEERRANRDVVASSLRNTRVPVSARLPEFRIPMRNLMALQPGSLLATSVMCESEVEVLVAGQKRFRGTAARVGRRLAVRVNSSVAADRAGQKTASNSEEAIG